MKRALVVAAALAIVAACGSFGADEGGAPSAPGDGGPGDTASGSSSSSSGSDGSLEGGVTPDAAADAGPCAACRSGLCDAQGCFALAFVTSQTFQGDFGNGMPALTFADDMCNKLGADPNRPATFAAWLSLPGQPAITRFVKGNAGTRPVVDSAGNRILNRYSDIPANEGLMNGIKIDETGAAVAGDQPVWTGTDVHGQPKDTCDGWKSGASADTGGTGLASAKGSDWTDDASKPCSSTARFYCFELVQ